MTLAALITDFIKSLEFEHRTSPLTIKNYHHYLKRFLQYAGDINPEDINLDLIRKYKLHLARKGLKKVTQNYFIIALRVFLRYLATSGVMTLSADVVELSEAQNTPLKVLSQDHLKQLLDAPKTDKKDGIRDKAILETLFSTGLLVSELAALNRDTIDLDSRQFQIVGKGGRQRVVFLSDAAASWLEKYLSARSDTFKPLFIRYQGKVDTLNYGEKMRLTTRSIERIVEKYVKAKALPVKATPHSLRHCFATDLITKGVDIRSVQAILGHHHLSTTQIYTKEFTLR